MPIDGHFRAFSFVDRITRLEPGVRAQGTYHVPSGLKSFQASLVAEAAGQLAAWSAMAAVDFSHRPVAGIAGTIELLGQVNPGQVLDLTAELECVDTETVGYGATAQVDGHPVLRLLDCVGPMVPLDEFDAPDVLRERLGLLRTVGANPGEFQGLPPLTLERQTGEEGRLARALLQVPPAAPLFADHFPRRPVFPGTLLMDANLQTAALLAAEVPCDNHAARLPRRVSDVKLRTFISPGETVSIEARLTRQVGDSLSVAVESRVNQRLVGSADIQFLSEVHS